MTMAGKPGRQRLGIHPHAAQDREVPRELRWAGSRALLGGKTFGAKMDAEGWLASERRMIERDEWVSPKKRVAEIRRPAHHFGRVRQDMDR